MHRYVAQKTALLPNGTLEEFTGEIISDTNAVGDAYSDIEGIDLGLSICPTHKIQKSGVGPLRPAPLSLSPPNSQPHQTRST